MAFSTPKVAFEYGVVSSPNDEQQHDTSKFSGEQLGGRARVRARNEDN